MGPRARLRRVRRDGRRPVARPVRRSRACCARSTAAPTSPSAPATSPVERPRTGPHCGACSRAPGTCTQRRCSGSRTTDATSGYRAYRATRARGDRRRLRPTRRATASRSSSRIGSLRAAGGSRRSRSCSTTERAARRRCRRASRSRRSRSSPGGRFATGVLATGRRTRALRTCSHRARDRPGSARRGVAVAGSFASLVAAVVGRGRRGDDRGRRRSRRPRRRSRSSTTTITFVDTSRSTPATPTQPASTTSGCSSTTIRYPRRCNERRCRSSCSRTASTVIPTNSTSSSSRGRAAGFVVAAPRFPRANVNDHGKAVLADAAEYPGDLSFVITRVLAMSVRRPRARSRTVIDPTKRRRRRHLARRHGGLRAHLEHVLSRPARRRRDPHERGPSGRSRAASTPVKEIPVMLIHGDADTGYRYSDRTYPSSRAPKWFVTLRGGRHGPPFEDDARRVRRLRAHRHHRVLGSLPRGRSIGCRAHRDRGRAQQRQGLAETRVAVSTALPRRRDHERQRVDDAHAVVVEDGLLARRDRVLGYPAGATRRARRAAPCARGASRDSGGSPRRT